MWNVLLFAVLLAATATEGGPLVTASHMLLPTEARAEAALAMVRGGNDFAYMAGSLSICPTRKNGGSLGTFGPGKMVAEFDQAIFVEGPFAPGTLLGPVRTALGYHVILIHSMGEGGDEL